DLAVPQVFDNGFNRIKRLIHTLGVNLTSAGSVQQQKIPGVPTRAGTFEHEIGLTSGEELGAFKSRGFLGSGCAFAGASGLGLGSTAGRLSLSSAGRLVGTILARAHRNSGEGSERERNNQYLHRLWFDC